MDPKPPTAPADTPSWRQRIACYLLQIPSQLWQLIQKLIHAEQQQLLDRQATRMIEGVLQVAELKVREIMIPSAQMITLPQQSTVAEVLPTIIDSAHSRFPVQSSHSDTICGILLAKDLLPSLLQPQLAQQPIAPLVRPASFIPESKRIDILLDEFRSNRKHMAIVVDEFGGTAGLITIEDVLEEIVGEIEDEYDSNPASFIKQLNAVNFQVNALTPLKYINQYFGTQFNSEQIDTLGGLINQKLGHIGKRGQQLQLDQLHVKILSVDARFIKQVQIRIPRNQAKKNNQKKT